MATDPSQEPAQTSSLVEVALSVPLPIFFTYRVPPGMSAPAGVRVRVPFGPRRLIGVVFGPGRPESVVGHKLRAIDAVLDPEPIIDAQALTLARWLADYWFAPPGEAVSLLLPPRMAEGEDAPTLRSTLYVRLVPAPSPPESPTDDAAAPAEPELKTRPKAKPRQLSEKMAAALEWLTKNGDATADTLRSATGITLDTLRRLADRNLIVLDSETRFRDPLAGVSLAGLRTPGGTHPLTPAQRVAADTVAASFGTYKGFLLHGVTGSGKTEVYLDLIERALASGMGSIVLVPEIALTPQLVSRFRARLGERVAVQHSGLDPLARHEQWLRIRSGELPVVVGARSALFAPLPNLGLVVVDEEHEPSFKQETSPRYHARDLALVRGNIAACPVVLGSATPSLESWTNVKRHKLTRLSLPERAHLNRPLPEVELVDMRPERERPAAPAAHPPASTAAHTGPSPDPLFSSQLLSAIESNLASGDQTLLFLNRRGYSSFIQCKTCGSTLDCRSCSVTYTWHRQRQRLVCHYCDESRPFPPACPRCNRKDLADLGHGTEQVEERLQHLFPDAAIARMDKDTTRGTALVKLLSRFRKGDIDVLIGTQMVAKGHDFPRVTLVGVLAAEHGLAFPDFRASERTFQLLTQIAGRAGRAERPGRVIVQTRMPDHYAIAKAVHHDVEGFLDLETELRAARGFPPTTHLALFRVSGRDLDETEATARRLVAHLREHLVGTASVTDAQPAPIERVKDRFRFQVLLRARERRDLRRVLDQTREHWSARLPSHLQIALDVDPLAFL